MKSTTRWIPVAILAGFVGVVLGGAGAWFVGPMSATDSINDDHVDRSGRGGQDTADLHGDHADHDHADHVDEHSVDEDDHDGHAEQNHDGDDHADHADDHSADDHGRGGEDSHADHDHADDHAGHDDHAERIALTAGQREAFGIVVDRVAQGRVDRAVKMTGQIAVNADRVTHIVPSAPGIVRSISVSMGDSVESGEVLAVLDSAELSAAKADYLAKVNELSCCSTDLTRAGGIEKSLKDLLKLLDSSPDLDQLQQAQFAELGEQHSQLVSAYAELTLAKAEYERERALRDQDISSTADFQAATNAYKKAYATYIALRSTVVFETNRSLAEATRSRQNAELEAQAARQQLWVMGMTTDDVASLEAGLVGSASGGTAHECTDPNCTDCEDHRPSTATPAWLAPPTEVDAAGPHVCSDPDCTDCESHAGRPAEKRRERDRGIGLYALRAPLSGTIIEKHISTGEKLSDDADVFTIADMRTVWVELSIYQKDLPYVHTGQTVAISAGEGVPETTGTLSYISPMVDPETRAVPARVVLNNASRAYRPGLFVTASIPLTQTARSVVVARDAVQVIEDRPCVFVPDGAGFVPVAVVLGPADQSRIEITSGLETGQPYVRAGAFELKSHMVTATMDSHAGHGH